MDPLFEFGARCLPCNLQATTASIAKAARPTHLQSRSYAIFGCGSVNGGLEPGLCRARSSVEPLLVGKQLSINRQPRFTEGARKGDKLVCTQENA